MVRSTLLQVALLAATTAASPVLRRQDPPPESAVVCFPYENKICNNGEACKCERPTDREKILESNNARRKYVNEYHENGLDFAATSFRIDYPEVYDEWYRTKSSLGGKSWSDLDKENQEAWDLRSELMDKAPEIYGESWMEIYEKKAANDFSGLVQVPGTEEWVKEGISPERLAELTDLVRQVNEAQENAVRTDDKEKEIIKNEFEPWLEEWLKQEEENLQDSEMEHLKWGVCGANDNSVTFRDTSAARTHMDNGRYVWEIDDFIARLSKDEMSSGGSTRGAMPWPEQYAIEYGLTQANTARDQKFGSCRSMTDTCRLFGAESNGQYSCNWFWDNSDKYNGKVGYWVWRLVEGVNHKIKLMSDTLTKDTLTQFLKLDTLNADFDPPEVKEDPAWKWFKFAFGMASSFLPMPPGLDESVTGNATEALEYFTSFLDAFEQISDEVKAAQEEKAAKPITSANLGDALGAIFDSMNRNMLANLETALGKSERVKDWDSLPSFGNVGNLKTPVGKFLNNPLWLIENDSEALKAVMASTTANVQYKIIDMKLRSENYYLTLDKRTTEKCEGKGARTFNYAGGDKCFRLYKIDSFTGDKKAKAADDDHYDKMAKYGLKDDTLTQYYQQILECYQKKGKDGELDSEEGVVPGGAAPTCFFSLRTAKLEKGTGCDMGFGGNTKNCNPFTSVDLEK